MPESEAFLNCTRDFALKISVSLIVMGCLSGCVVVNSSEPMQFPIIATKVPTGMSSTLIKASVVEIDCPEKGGRYGNYRKAMDRALLNSPGANALINVELRSVPRGMVPKTCVEVRGDAVHF
jgi:hypothetical protein